MSSVQRTNFSHVLTLIKSIENPISAISKLIENSIQVGAT